MKTGISFLDAENIGLGQVFKITGSKDAENRPKIYHCATDFEILATLLQYHRSFQPSEALVILIDSIDTFCVHDKLLGEQTTQGLTLQHQYFQLIQRLVKDHCALVIGTKSSDSVMPATWTTQVNTRITLIRTREDKFHVLSQDQRPEYRVTESGIEEA